MSLFLASTKAEENFLPAALNIVFTRLTRIPKHVWKCRSRDKSKNILSLLPLVEFSYLLFFDFTV